ncbi:MAG: nucleotidyltransferase family protein [Leptospiraceae bacterium]|nr:nucleotidyltransferase family protein [Leptospiraceae bacterium]
MRAFHTEKMKQVQNLLANSKERIRQTYGVKIIGVFGSHARNDAHLESDVDILVELERPIGLKFFALWDELEELLSCKVDLITKDSAKQKLSLYQNIMKDLVYV